MNSGQNFQNVTKCDKNRVMSSEITSKNEYAKKNDEGRYR